MRPPLVSFIVILFASALGYSAEQGEDWPSFLGPRHNGISGETGLLDRIPTNGVPIAWTKTIGTGYGAPALVGNKLVLHHRLEDTEIVECLDATSGVSKWKF